MTTTQTSVRPVPRTPLPETVAREVREWFQRDLDRVSEDVRPLVELVARRLFSPDLDANYLRRHCSPSRRTLKRFREQLGLTLRAYVDARRMAAAERLLAVTDMKVWQVAEAVGCRRKDFASQLKKVTGRSPREVQAAADGRERASPREPRAATQRLDGRPSVPREAPSPPSTSSIMLTVVELAGTGSQARRTLYFYDASRASFVSCRDAKLMTLAARMDRIAAAFAASTGKPVQPDTDQDANDVYLGWRVEPAKQVLKRAYAIGSFERLRPFAYRIARLASKSGPHLVTLRFEGGVLMMRVEPAVGLDLSGDQYRLVASVDERYGELFGARDSTCRAADS